MKCESTFHFMTENVTLQPRVQDHMKEELVISHWVGEVVVFVSIISYWAYFVYLGFYIGFN